MFKKVLFDALGCFGIYTLYINGLNVLTKLGLSFTIDANLMPFFWF